MLPTCPQVYSAHAAQRGEVVSERPSIKDLMRVMRKEELEASRNRTWAQRLWERLRMF